MKLMFAMKFGFPFLLFLAFTLIASPSRAADDEGTSGGAEAGEVELIAPDGTDSDSGEHEAGEHGDGEHSDAEHGEEDEGGILSFDFGSAFFNLLIFLFVFAFLSAFVWPSVLGGLKAREDKIRGDLQAAEAANQKAEALLQQYQVKLDDAAQQVQTMLGEARQDAEANGQRIVEDAKQEAVRQRERAVADIDTAKKVAMSEIAGQTSEIAMQLARGVVGRELNADDHSDLIRQSLDQLPSSN